MLKDLSQILTSISQLQASNEQLLDRLKAANEPDWTTPELTGLVLKLDVRLLAALLNEDSNVAQQLEVRQAQHVRYLAHTKTPSWQARLPIDGRPSLGCYASLAEANAAIAAGLKVLSILRSDAPASTDDDSSPVEAEAKAEIETKVLQPKLDQATGLWEYQGQTYRYFSDVPVPTDPSDTHSI